MVFRMYKISFVLLCAISGASLAFAAPFPEAKDVLASVRLRQSQQELELQGELREGPTVVPFRLTQTGPIVRYSFSNPDETLQLHLGENDSRLEVVTREGVEKIAPAQFDHKVRGTNITYEDLSLRFLYWQTGRVTAENEIRTIACWKLEMKAPSRQSQYSNVWLWVGKENGALMKMEAYDWNAKLSKSFEVVSGQKIEGRWFLKEMRIEERDPATGKVKRTYLDITK
jgi:Outer membrane lipoprotein-sorting protein